MSFQYKVFFWMTASESSGVHCRAETKPACSSDRPMVMWVKSCIPFCSVPKDPLGTSMPDSNRVLDSVVKEKSFPSTPIFLPSLNPAFPVLHTLYDGRWYLFTLVTLLTFISLDSLKFYNSRHYLQILIIKRRNLPIMQGSTRSHSFLEIHQWYLKLL